MAYDRPSWKEIDQRRDGSSRRGRSRTKEKKAIKEHSTRYDKYKADLNRLFDQGLAGELLKKASRDAPPAEEEKPQAARKDAKQSPPRRKGGGRIPKDTTKATSRLKLIRAISDAPDAEGLRAAIDELVANFGLPDDWEVLVRVCEHTDEALISKAITRMLALLPQAKKVPRKASLKERLRTIGQTAADMELRKLAETLEDEL